MDWTTDYNYIVVALLFIIFDILTGVIGACIMGEFQSNKMRKGGLHKLGLITVIAFGVALDYGQYLIDFGFDIPCCVSICSFLALMEILSCIENINHAFPNALPKALTNILYQTAKDNGVEVNEGDKDNG